MTCKFAQASAIAGPIDRTPAILDRGSVCPPAMNRDPLSDVLRSAHRRGAIFFYVSSRDEWVAETAENSTSGQC